MIKRVKDYKYSEFVQQISDEKLFDLYMQIRFKEEESKFTNYQKTTIIRDSVQMAGIEGINGGILAFELLLNKTFDYSGSLSYIKKRRTDLGK